MLVTTGVAGKSTWPRYWSKNMFEALMEAVKTHSPGQISHALYDVGGECRRNM